MRLIPGILLLICLSIPSAFAQQIRGTIQDAETREALVGASIFVPSLQVGSISDSQGAYTLDLDRAGTYRIVFSYIGFSTESRVVMVGPGVTQLDVALTPTAIEAPAVTITARGQAADILSTPQAVAVLEAEDLTHRRGTTAFEAIEQAPGVRLQRTGTTIAKPVIRGLSAQRVLVVQDGVRQEGQQWGDEHGPEIDPYDVERVEIVKGPSSLLYGSDALGGVVEATGEDLFGYKSAVHARLDLQAMSSSMLGGGRLELGGRNGNTVYQAGVSLRDAGSYETPRGFVPNTGSEELNGSLRLGYRVKRTTLVADFQHFGTRLGMFEPDAAPSLARREIGYPYQRVQHDRIFLKGEVPFRGHRMEVIGALQQNRRKEYVEPEAGAPLEPELFLRLTTATLDTRLHHRPIGRLFGAVGLSGMYQRNETLAEESLIPAAYLWNGAAYVAEELTLDRVTISGGMRLDTRHLQAEPLSEKATSIEARQYYALSGAFGLTWQPVHTVSIGINAGRAWRAPVLIELYSNGIHEGTARYEIGDPDLNPEKSLSLDATARWLTSHFFFELSGFINQVDGFVFPRPTGETDSESGYQIYRYAQAPARLWGAELTADLHPHPLDWLHLRLVGDLVRSTNQDTDGPLPLTPSPRLAGQVVIHAGKIWSASDVSFHFGPTFVARQTSVSDFEVPADAYTLWDASASAHFMVSKVKISPVLAVDNLFDSAYMATLSRFKPYGILDPGRNVRFSLRIDFGE